MVVCFTLFFCFSYLSTDFSYYFRVLQPFVPKSKKYTTGERWKKLLPASSDCRPSHQWKKTTRPIRQMMKFPNRKVGVLSIFTDLPIIESVFSRYVHASTSNMAWFPTRFSLWLGFCATDAFSSDLVTPSISRVGAAQARAEDSESNTGKGRLPADRKSQGVS